MEGKHFLCKHPNSCFWNAINGYVRGASLGLILRAAITIIAGLFRRTLIKNPASILKMFSKENMRIVIFLSGMVGVHRTILCLLRRYTHNERISSFVAGFCSAIPLIVEDGESRVLYSLYMLIRSFDAICKYLVSHNIVPKIPHCIEYLYILSTTVLHYSKVWHPDCVNKGYGNVLNRFMKEPNDHFYIDMIGYTDKLLLKRK